jgi:hypothetical protein
MATESVLQVIDLTDNYVDDLSQLKILQSFRYLSDVSFRHSSDHTKGSNPICDQPQYTAFIAHCVPNLRLLDGQ